MYLSRSLSVCLSRAFSLCPPSLARFVSPPIYLSLSQSPSVTLLLRLSFYFYLCRFIFISLTYSSSPPPCFVAHSPTQFFRRLACVCLFLSIPRSASCLLLMLFVCGSPSVYKTLTLLSAFSPPPLSLSICIPLSDSPSPLSLSVSPDIHVEIFSHVRYRFMTPVRSPWPLNLIPSTKPHCFFVCLGLSVVCNCG